jgi:membrane-bound inhibitor of C-type lysozyme
MIETVVALCMFVAGELKEHRIQPAMSDCLKGKRLAERDKSDTVNYKCGKVKVELENNIDGSKSIKKIVKE